MPLDSHSRRACNVCVLALVATADCIVWLDMKNWFTTLMEKNSINPPEQWWTRRTTAVVAVYGRVLSITTETWKSVFHARFISYTVITIIMIDMNEWVRAKVSPFFGVARCVLASGMHIIRHEMGWCLFARVAKHGCMRRALPAIDETVATRTEL